VIVGDRKPVVGRGPREQSSGQKCDKASLGGFSAMPPLPPLQRVFLILQPYIGSEGAFS
jgi:hypothetical protein